MIKSGVVELFISFWVFFVVFCIKKDGFVRFCIDYCCFNLVIYKDFYFLFCIDDFFDVF